MPQRDAAATRDDIERVARDSFGLEHLRPAQLDAIEAAVAGRDVLAVFATGYGKSAVYQVAAAMRPGVAVVVSPLIALQEDQLVGLEGAPDAPVAVALNSARGSRARADAWRRLHDGEARLVLLAPEQLAKDEVLDELAELDVSLLAVDEAHCVASWGHDFRPDYLMIGAMAERLGRPPVVALTATASTPVREEIVARLGMHDPHVLIGDMDRPNIALAVRRHVDDDNKRRAVVEETAALAHPGLLYTATRRDAERYAAELAERGLRTAAYHAGLPAAERGRVHEAFLAGELDVVSATSAFGMGIDKEDVRFVVHADTPDSVDAYYQELGRAGRDGEPAQATLHYRPEDLALRRWFASRRPDADEVGSLYDALGERERSRSALARATGLSPRRVTALLSLLSDTGVVRLGRRGAALRRGAERTTAVETALRRIEERELIDRSRIEVMRGYAETRQCRRQVLLEAFGRERGEPCGNCDTCEAGTATAATEASPVASGFTVDERVRHDDWGEGTVMSVEEDRMTVFFDSVGYKLLSLALIEEHGLLQAAG
ncbi:RecQ family ATP-dependent DNA helicase [Microbacterium sp. NPDC096154]|uniref:RecQ family ATP-dependent DNA helicase n=1 Tax=Microbacterium sp. NPDC096154 TaxID=3155549 RepID=UPI00332265AB